MSKYTEAETKIKKIMCEEIDRLPSHFDGEDEVYDSTKDVDEILKLNKTVCKALQIADRLEQADVKRHEPYIRDMATFEGTEAIGYVTMWFKLGYETALSDIRGDADE